MKVYLLFEKIFQFLISWLWRVFIIIHEYRNIFSKRNILKTVQLSQQQKKQIDDFFQENYGKKVPHWWHRLYTSYTGKFDFRYIPEIIFSAKIEPITNNRLKTFQFEDKNMIPVLFGQIDDVRIPETVIFRCENRFYNGKRELITEQEALRVMNAQDKTELVIKKTVDSSSGRDVRFLRFAEGVDLVTGDRPDQIFSQMGENFLVQQKVTQHPALEKIYPHAINTLRVITYQIKGEICVAPVVLRIGRGGNKVDNAHAGGMFIGVSENGTLLKEAFTEYQLRFTEHPDTHLVFEGYQLPVMDKVKSAARRLHQQIPIMGYVSWDFSINPEEEVVLIEANLHSQAVWISQMAHGTAFFGGHTADVLQEYACKR